jgi:ribosomal protein L44E
VKRIAARSECTKCGVTHGPWAIKGLKMYFDEHNMPHSDDQDAELWCRKCHMQSIAQTGGLASGKARHQ